MALGVPARPSAQGYSVAAPFFLNSEVHGLVGSAWSQEEAERKAIVLAVNTGRTVHIVDTSDLDLPPGMLQCAACSAIKPEGAFGSGWKTPVCKGCASDFRTYGCD